MVKIGKREIFTNDLYKDILLEIGHIINKTNYEKRNKHNSDDVFAYNTAIRFISYGTSPSLDSKQVMEIASILIKINYDPNIPLYP